MRQHTEAFYIEIQLLRHTELSALLWPGLAIRVTAHYIPYLM